MFHFVRTGTGALASERFVIGQPKSGRIIERHLNLGIIFRVGRSSGPMDVPADAVADPVNIVTVLSVSSDDEDHAVLQQTFEQSEVTLYPNCRVTVQRSNSLASAVAGLRLNPVPIVIFDEDSLPGAWPDMVAAIKGLPSPPCLIVTAQEADDRLWADALNHGAFDVIVKPFNKTDVIRIVTSAWRRWRNRYAQEPTPTVPEKRPAQS